MRKLGAEKHFLPVARVAQRRPGVVGDNLRHGRERVLADVVAVVGCQLDRNVVDAVGAQHRQSVRTPGLQQTTSNIRSVRRMLICRRFIYGHVS